MRTLLGLFLRTRSFRLALVPLLVASLLGWTSYLVLESRHLSPEQQVVSALGESDGVTTMAAQVAPGRSPADTGHLFDGVQIDAVRLIAQLDVETHEGQMGLVYHEQPLPNPSVTGDLNLASGRWPSRPGEVAVHEGTGLSVGGELRAVHGDLALTVVGVVSSVWSASQDIVHGAPGTWKEWRISSREVQEAGVTSFREVYWSSPHPAEVVSRLDRNVERSSGPFCDGARHPGQGFVVQCQVLDGAEAPRGLGGVAGSADDWRAHGEIAAADHHSLAASGSADA